MYASVRVRVGRELGGRVSGERQASSVGAARERRRERGGRRRVQALQALQALQRERGRVLVGGEGAPRAAVLVCRGCTGEGG